VDGVCGGGPEIAPRGWDGVGFGARGSVGGGGYGGAKAWGGEGEGGGEGGGGGWGVGARGGERGRRRRWTVGGGGGHWASPVEVCPTRFDVLWGRGLAAGGVAELVLSGVGGLCWGAAVRSLMVGGGWGRGVRGGSLRCAEGVAVGGEGSELGVLGSLVFFCPVLLGVACVWEFFLCWCIFFVCFPFFFYFFWFFIHYSADTGLYSVHVVNNFNQWNQRATCRNRRYFWEV